MTARPPDPALDVNAAASESLDHVADLFESGEIAWTPWPLEDGAAFSLLGAVNEFAADVDPAPQVLPPRWGWAIRFRRSERVWAATGGMDVALWNAMSGRTVEDVVEALRTAASMEPPLHLCPDCKIERLCVDLACVGHPARPDDELAREILCRRCWPDRPW